MKKFFSVIGNKIKKHKVRSAVIGVLFVAVIGIISVMLMHTGNDKSVAQGNRQNMVRLSKMDLTSSVSATGTLESAETMKVSASLNNVKITEVKVKEGDTVTKGQTLVSFDKEDLQDSYDDAVESLSDARSQADDELSSAKKKLSDAKETYETEKSRAASSVSSAKAEYQSAKSTAADLKKQLNTEKDSEKKAKLQEELTKAEQEQKQAKTSYENAVNEKSNTIKQNKSNIESAKSAVKTAENNKTKSVREAKRSVDDAKESLDACSVTAPMTGTVTAVGVNAGDTYSGGDMFEISDCENLQVSTSVDEYDINQVKKGQRVVILTDATGEDEIEGEITFVAPTTGSGSLNSSGSGASSLSQTGTSTSSGGSSTGYTVTINIKKADERLKVGMTAKCSIILEEVTDVFAVPYDAIHTNSNGESVIYTVTGQKNTAASERGKRAADSQSENSQSKPETSQKEIVVTKGMESDYYVEISGDELTEGLMVILPSDTTESSNSSESEKASNEAGSLPGMDGGMEQNRGNKSFGGGNAGGAPAGGPGGNPF